MSISDSSPLNTTSTSALLPSIFPDLPTILSLQLPLLILNVVFMLFMLAILLARLYVRRNLLHSLGWDDCQNNLDDHMYRLTRLQIFAYQRLLDLLFISH